MLAINADQNHNRYTDVTKYVTTVAADKDVVSAFRPTALVSYLKRISKEYGLQLDSNVPTIQLSAPVTTWCLSNNCFSVHVTLSKQSSRVTNSKLKEIHESPPFVALVTFVFNGSEPVSCSELAQDLNRCKYSSLSRHVRNILSFFSVPGDGFQQARAYLCLQAVEQDLDQLARANLPPEAALPAIATQPSAIGRPATSDGETMNLESHCKLVNRSLVGLFRPRSGGRLAQLAYLVTPAQKAMARFSEPWSSSSTNDLSPAVRECSQTFLSAAGRRLPLGGTPLGFLARITLRSRSVPAPSPAAPKQEAVCPSKVLPRIQFIPFVTREEGGHGDGGLHFAEPDDINSLAIEAELVLLLDPPLPLPTQAVRLLEQVTGLSNTELVESEKADLVYHVLARHNQRHLYGVTPHLQMPNMTQHSYQLHSVLHGYLVRSVPFTCSSQLSQIMDILRQHASTSAFLESFVLHPRRATEKDDAMTFHFNIDIVSSREILVKFDHPCEIGRKVHVSLQIGKFSVDSAHLDTTSGASSTLSDGLTEILRKCHALPVGLVWLLTRLGCPVHRSLPLPKPVAAPLPGNRRKRMATVGSDDFRHLKRMLSRASSQVIIEGVAGSDGLLSGADRYNLQAASLPPVASMAVTSAQPAIANSSAAGFLGGLKLPPGVLVATPPPPIATAAASTSRGVRLDDLLMVDNNMCQLQQSRIWPPPGGLVHDPSNRQPGKPHSSTTGLLSGGLGNRAGEYGPAGGKLTGNHGQVASALGSVNRSGQSTLPSVPPAPPISIPGTFIQTATMGSQIKMAGSMLVNLLNEEPPQPSSASFHSNHHHHQQQHHHHGHQKSTSSPQQLMHQHHIPNPGAGGLMNPSTTASSCVSASSSLSTISSVIQQPARQQPAPPPPPLPGLLDTSRYSSGTVVAAGSHQRPCPPSLANPSNVGKTFSSPTPIVTTNSSSAAGGGGGGVNTSGPACVSPVTVPSFSSMVSSLLPASVSSSPMKNPTSVRSGGKPLGRSSSNVPSAGIHRHSSTTPVSEFGKKTRKRRRVFDVGGQKGCANSAPPGGSVLSQAVRTRLGDTGSNGIQSSRSGPVPINSVPMMGTATGSTSGTRLYSGMPHSELVSSASFSLPLSLPQSSGIASGIASKSVYDFDDNPNATFDVPSSGMVLPQATVCTTDTISASGLGNSFNVGGGGGVSQATCVTSRLSGNAPTVSSSGLVGAASGQQMVTSGTPLPTGMTPERTVERKTSLKMTIKTLPALQPPLGGSQSGSITKPPAHRLSKLSASGGAKITSPTGRHSASGIDGKHKLLLSGQVAMKKRRRRSIEGKPQSYFLQMQQHGDAPSSSAAVSSAAAPVAGQFPSGKDGGNRMGKLNMTSLKSCISPATLKKERKRRSVAGTGATVVGLVQLTGGSSTVQSFEAIPSSGPVDTPVDTLSLMKLTGKATVGKKKPASSVGVNPGCGKQRKLPGVSVVQSFSSTFPGASVGATATPMTSAAVVTVTTTAVTTTGSSPLAVNSLQHAAPTSTSPQTIGDAKRRKLTNDAQSAAANRNQTQLSTTSLFNLSLSSSSQSESDDMTLLLSTAGSDVTQQQSLSTSVHQPSSSSFTKLQRHTSTPTSTGAAGSLASALRQVKSCRASGVPTVGTTGGLIKGYKIPKKKNLGEVLGKQTNLGSVNRLDRIGSLDSLAIARSASATPPPATTTTTTVVPTAPSAKPLPSFSSISSSCVAGSVPTTSAGLTAGSSALLPLPVAARRSNAKSISDIVDKLRAKSTSMSGVKSSTPSAATDTTTDSAQLATESTALFPTGFADDLEAFAQQDGRRDNIFEKFASGGSASHTAGRPASTGLSTGRGETHLGSGMLSQSPQLEDGLQAEAGPACSSSVYTTDSEVDGNCCWPTTANTDNNNNNRPVAGDLAQAPDSSRFPSLQADQVAVATDSNVALGGDRSSPYELIKAMTDTPASPTASPKPVRGDLVGSPCDSAGACLQTLPVGSSGIKGTGGSGSVVAEAASRIIPISPTVASNINSCDSPGRHAPTPGSGGGQKRSAGARNPSVHGGDHPVGGGGGGGGPAAGAGRFARPLSDSAAGRQVDGFLRNPGGHMRHGRPPTRGFSHSLHRSKPVNFKGGVSGGPPGSTWPGPHLPHPPPRLMDYATHPPLPPPTSIHPDHPSGPSSFQGVGGGAAGSLPWIASPAATTGPLAPPHGLPPPLPGQQRHLGPFQPGPPAGLRPGTAVPAGPFPGNTSLFSGSGSMPGPLGTGGPVRGASRGKK